VLSAWALTWSTESRHIPLFYQKPSSKIDTSYHIGVYLRGAETKEDCYRRSHPVVHPLNQITAPSYGDDSRSNAGGAEYRYEFVKK